MDSFLLKNENIGRVTQVVGSTLRRNLTDRIGDLSALEVRGEFEGKSVHLVGECSSTWGQSRACGAAGHTMNSTRDGR